MPRGHGGEWRAADRFVNGMMQTSSEQPELVSVVMPVHNREDYVGLAIESILQQTYGQFELIVVDDGSTDRSPQILDEYGRRDRRVRVVHQPSAGIAEAMNRGIDLASGELVARMDSDDVSLPERLRLQVDFLRTHPEVVVVGGQALAIDAEGDPLYQIRTSLEHGELEATILGRTPVSRGTIVSPSAMMRREAVLKVGKFRRDFEPAEDRDLWLRLSEVGRLANLPDVILQYRMHDGCVSITRAEVQYRNACRAIREACERRGLSTTEPIEMWSLEERTKGLRDHDSRRALAAARSGYSRTARKYVRRVISRRPWDRRAWKAMLISLLGTQRAAQLGRLRRRDADLTRTGVPTS